MLTKGFTRIIIESAVHHTIIDINCAEGGRQNKIVHLPTCSLWTSCKEVNYGLWWS